MKQSLIPRLPGLGTCPRPAGPEQGVPWGWGCLCRAAHGRCMWGTHRWSKLVLLPLLTAAPEVTTGVQPSLFLRGQHFTILLCRPPGTRQTRLKTYALPGNTGRSPRRGKASRVGWSQTQSKHPTAVPDKKGEVGKSTFSTQQAFIGHLWCAHFSLSSTSCAEIFPSLAKLSEKVRNQRTTQLAEFRWKGVWKMEPEGIFKGRASKMVAEEVPGKRMEGAFKAGAWLGKNSGNLGISQKPGLPVKGYSH